MSPRAPEAAGKQHLILTQQVGRHIKRRSPRVNATPNKPAYKTQTVRRRNKASPASEEANPPVAQHGATQRPRSADATPPKGRRDPRRGANQRHEARRQRKGARGHTAERLPRLTHLRRSPPAGVCAGAHTPYMTTAVGAEGGKTPRGADASPTPLPFALRWRPVHRGHRSDDFQRLNSI